MTAFNYSNMHPARREHFVYRAFDAKGQLLYVGCTMDIKRRRGEHKMSSKWWPAAVRFRVSGPYNYSVGRQLEREAIKGEHPLWNHNEPRRFRIEAMRTRIYNRAFRSAYAATGSVDAAYDAMDEVRELIAERAYDRPLTDMDVARAERADRDHANRATA